MALCGQRSDRGGHITIRVRVHKSAVTVLQNQAYSKTFYPRTEILARVLIKNKEFREIWPHGGPDAGGTLWLQVRDVYAAEKELADRGVPIAREARREPWGLHEMHVSDPDGVTLIFVQVPETHPLRRDTRN